MHPRALDERASAARKKLKSAAERLSERLDIGEIAEIDPRDRRDPAIFAMRELEVLADFLDKAARASITPEAEPVAEPTKAQPKPKKAP